MEGNIFKFSLHKFTRLFVKISIILSYWESTVVFSTKTKVIFYDKSFNLNCIKGIHIVKKKTII